MPLMSPYNVTTNNPHTPTWDGELAQDGSGNWSFTPSGGSAVPVNLQTGSDDQGEWIQFTNTQAQPRAVHYQKAHQVANGNDFQGSANNNDGSPGDTDDWTAVPQGPDEGKY